MNWERLDQTSTDEREKLDVYRHQRRGDQTSTDEWEDSTRRQRTKGRNSTFIDTNGEVNTSLGKEKQILATGNQTGRLPTTLLGISSWGLSDIYRWLQKRLDVYRHRKMMFTDIKKWPDIYRWLGRKPDVYRHRNNGVYRHQKWWPDIYWWLGRIPDVYRHRNNGVYRHQTKKHTRVLVWHLPVSQERLFRYVKARLTTCWGSHWGETNFLSPTGEEINLCGDTKCWLEQL